MTTNLPTWSKWTSPTGQILETEYLSQIYEGKSHPRHILTNIKINGNEILKQHPHIWINGQPAEYLKRFKWFVHDKQEDISFSKFENNSLELKSKSLEQTIIDTIVKLPSGELRPKKLSKHLKIIGIKKILTDKDKEPKKKLDKCFPYYDDSALHNYNTLEELGTRKFTDKTPIEFRDFSKTDTKPSLQGTKLKVKEFYSINRYKEYISQINERMIPIVVCLFVEKYGKNQGIGTGFLIAKNMFITNHHVLSDDIFKYYQKNGYKLSLKFFYEDNVHLEEQISLSLLDNNKVHFDFVHTSERYKPKEPFDVPEDTPDAYYAFPKAQKLDFTIIQYTGPEVSDRQKKQMVFLAEKASNFFRKPNEEMIRPFVQNDEQNNNNNNKIKALDRATIVQHPENTGCRKQIVFRDILGTEKFLIHYNTGTYSGTSGSPVANGDGNFIALHVSSCTKLNEELYRNRHKISPLMNMHFETYGLRKGYCKVSKRLCSPLDIIKDHLSKLPNGLAYDSPEEYAAQLLLEADCCDPTIKVHAGQCNIGISAIDIFENLDSKGKLQAIQVAQNEARTDAINIRNLEAREAKEARERFEAEQNKKIQRAVDNQKEFDEKEFKDAKTRYDNDLWNTRLWFGLGGGFVGFFAGIGAFMLGLFIQKRKTL